MCPVLRASILTENTTISASKPLNTELDITTPNSEITTESTKIVHSNVINLSGYRKAI